MQSRIPDDFRWWPAWSMTEQKNMNTMYSITGGISTTQIAERLAAINPTQFSFDEAKLADSFNKYLTSLRIFNPLPSLHFMYGIGANVNGFNPRLNDLGVYGSTDPTINSSMWSRIRATPRRLDHSGGLSVPQWFNAYRFIWPIQVHFHLDFFYDENILEAYEHGLDFFIVKRNIAVVVLRPLIRTREETNSRMPNNRITVLHSGVAPAVEYPLDPASNQYWLRGVRVPQFVVTNPERINRAHIRAARTPQMRRTLVDQYGLLKWAIERGYKQHDTSEQFGATLYVKGGNRSRYGGTTFRECIVELINSTPEPDGTRRHTARRVPGHMQTAKEAVAWTFNLQPDQYNPVVQT